MPITNEDIIYSLVAHYKRTGVDMTALLGDPVFQAMKVAEKIEAIKTYAKDIHDGSSSDLTTSEKKRIALDAAWKTGFAVVPAIAAIGLRNSAPRLLQGVHNRALLGVSLGGVAIGAGIGALQGYLASKNARDHKEQLRSNLARVIQNPSTTNAVGVLSTDNVSRQNAGYKDMLVGRAIENLEKYDVEKKTHSLYQQMLPLYQEDQAANLGVRYRKPKL